jgi:Cysteine-rich CPCC
MDPAPEEEASPEELARRVAWFHEDAAQAESQPPQLPLRCPCCGCLTLGDRGRYEICPVCFWEDDGQDDYDADIIRGGPNGTLSLTQARANYRWFGACDARSVASVRPPRADELSG